MAGGFVFVGKSRLRKIRKETRKLKKLETKKKSPPGVRGSGDWSPGSQKVKYEALISPRDDIDNISVCSTDSAISSGSDEDFLPLIDLRPHSTVFTMPFGPFKKSKEQEEKKRLEAEKEKQRLEEEERLRQEEEERLRREEEERLRLEEEERKRKEEEERLAEEQRVEEERKKVEAEAKKTKLFGRFGLSRNKSTKDVKSEETTESKETENKEEMNIPEKELKIGEDSTDGTTENKPEETNIFNFGFIDKLRQLGKTGNEEQEVNKAQTTNEEPIINEKVELENAENKQDESTVKKNEDSDIFSIFKRFGRRNSEELRQKEEEEARLKAEEERKIQEEEESARLEEEERRKAEEDKGIFGIALFKSKFLKPKEEKPEQEPLTAPVVEAKEAEPQQLTDAADGKNNQKVEKAKVAGEEKDCTEMLCCTIM